MVLALFLVLALMAQAGCAYAQQVPVTGAEAIEQYLSKIDAGYAYDVAYRLSTDPAMRSSSLGSRTAGSDAEHAAADYLAGQMEALGLADVEKVPVSTTRWQFNDATLTLPDGSVIKPHSYATAATPAEGITAQILYLGKGTMQDYEGVDAAGKIVLIDIDQRADWWITYPMLEAQLQGAAAIMSANVGGFAQLNGDALNAQDICAPTGIPCVSISLNDSTRIREMLEEGPVTATLTVDNEVTPGGTTYNVTGRIPGKGSGEDGEIILVGAHYDMYFNGFQDDNCAAALVLAMAKAMLESGYTPQRDIVFCLHGAEEWGASGTQFDWTVGAWRMIYEAHPEWVGRILTFVNFELPAYQFAGYTYVTSAPELYTLIDRFVNESGLAPQPEGCFPEGVKTEGYPTYTYSDDFSYYVAGVPGTCNGFLMTEDQQDVYPFYYERYHSQFDDPDTFDEAVFTFNTRFYGALVMAIDAQSAYLLDFGAQADRLEAAFDQAAFQKAGADEKGYRQAVEQLRQAAQAAYAQGEAINARYEQARAQGDQAAMEAAWDEGQAYNRKVLSAFKLAQDELLGLMYERPIVPHEAQMENIGLMEQIVALLEAGQGDAALDEYAWRVNNVLEWYNMYFSPETTQITSGMFYSEDNRDNLFWGTDKMFPLAQVEQATRSLMARYGQGGDYAGEIGVYQQSMEDQSALMRDSVDREIAGAKALSQLLAG